MANDFTYYAPTKVVFGKGAEAQVGKLVKEQNCKKVLIHYGGGSAKRSGLLDRITDSLEKEGVDYVSLGGVVPNPRLSLVYEGIELCKKEGVDFILAVGVIVAINVTNKIIAPLSITFVIPVKYIIKNTIKGKNIILKNKTKYILPFENTFLSSAPAIIIPVIIILIGATVPPTDFKVPCNTLGI